MTVEEFAQQIQALNMQVAALNTKAAESPLQQPALLTHALAEIRTGLEELVAAQEALRDQNDGQLAARATLEEVNSIHGEAGKTPGLPWVSRDNAESKRAEEDLEKSESRYRSLFENMLDGFAFCKMLFDDGKPQDFIYLDVNSAFEKLTGLENVLGKKVSEIIPGIAESNPELFEIYGRVSLTGKPERFETCIESLGIWFSISVYSPEKEYFVAVFENITDRKRAEEALWESKEALQASEERFALAVRGSNDGIFDWDIVHDSLYWSPRYMEMLGYPADESVTTSSHFESGLHPDDRERARATLIAHLKHRGPYDMEVRLCTKSGEYRCFRIRGQALWNESGWAVRLIGAMTDITERKQAEEALAQERNVLRTLIDSLPDYIYVKDTTGRFVLGNAALARVMGATAPDDLIGKTDHDFYPQELAAQYYAGEQEVIRSGQAVVGREEPIMDAVGKPGWILTSQVPLREPNGEVVGLVGIGRDITALKEAEEALLASEKRFRILVENSSDTIAMISGDGTLHYVGPSHYRVLGRDEGEYISRGILEFVHPEDREKVTAQLSQLARKPGQVEMIEARMRHQDGSWRWLEAVLHNLLEEPSIQAIVVNYRDITERKRAEEQIQRRANEFAALYETARDLTTVQDLSALLQTVVRRAVSLVDAASGSIDLYDRARQEVEIAAVQGVGLSIGARFRMGEGVAGRVAQNREPIIVDDYQTWEHRSPTYTQIPFRAILELPMLHRGELIGVLAVHELGDSTRKFSEADARLLSLFAAQAAAAVSNARLLVETSARAQQLALLYDAGLALNSVLEPRAQLEFLFNIAAKALRADRAEFFSYDAGRDEARFELGIGFDEASEEALRNIVFSEGRGVVGWVAKNRVPVTVPDVLNDSRWIPVETQVRSALFIPVEHESELHGVLGVLSKCADAFTPQDERLLALFGNQAAVALENGRLFEETQHRLAELEAVNKISAALRLSQSLDEMLPALLDEILAVLGTSAGQISLYDAESDVLRVAVARGWFAQAPVESNAGEGIRVHVMRTGQSYVLQEFKSDPNTSATSRSQVPAGWGGALIPLSVGRDVIGVLAISVRLPREIQPRELQLLNTLAEIAGNAIHRARLHQRTEHQMQHLAALHTIDMAISASLDLKFSLDIILEQIMAELRIDAVDVLLLKPLSQTLEYAAGRGFQTDSLRYTRLRLGEGLAGRAALERRLVSVSDLAQDPDGLLRSKKLAIEHFVAYYAAPLIAKGQIKGVLEIFHRAPLNPDLEWLGFLEALATQLAIAVDSAELFVELQRSNVELALAYDTTLEGWGRALDLRDKETEGHTERVTKLTVQLARRIGLSEAELVNARRGALLHDIGKMGISDHILHKPGPLTPEEWEIMRRHPVYAYELLLPIPFLRTALDIPYCHHEKWDGSGYPRGLKGDQIPLAARIFAVVDVWDALRSDRPYRGAWGDEQVYKYIQEQAGTHFDPKIVQAFLQLMDAESEGAGPLPQRGQGNLAPTGDELSL